MEINNRIAGERDDLATKPRKHNYSLWILLLLLTIALTFGFVWYQLSPPTVPSINKVISQNKTFETSFKPLNEALLPQVIQLSNSEALQKAEDNSNLAATYWERWKFSNTMSRAGVTHCEQVQLNTPFRVHHHNRYWQKMVTKFKNAQERPFNMYLYNAYYDDRVDDAPTVKMLTVNNHGTDGQTREWWCLLWFEGIKAPALVPAQYLDIWPQEFEILHQNDFRSQLITCPVPTAFIGDVPQAVSLQDTGDCSQMKQFPSNVLRVIQNNNKTNLLRQNRSIGLCAKAITIQTTETRLVEWLEMVRLLGVDKVYLYVYSSTEKMLKVLRHYQSEGLVEWRQITLPGEQPNVDALYDRYIEHLGGRFGPQESMIATDCLYRHLHQHNYLAVFNVDEMIVPLDKSDWHGLIDDFEAYMTFSQTWETQAYMSSRYALVCADREEPERNTGFILSKKHPIPSTLYMMRHTFRTDLKPGTSAVKSIVRPELVHSLQSNIPVRCLYSTGFFGCQGVNVDPKRSLLLHYGHQPSTDDPMRNPNCSIRDRTAWRYYEQLEHNVRLHTEKIF